MDVRVNISVIHSGVSVGRICRLGHIRSTIDAILHDLGLTSSDVDIVVTHV
jgi:hypothetical protein